MHDLGDRAKIEQQVFAAPNEPLQRLPRQLQLQIVWHRPAQARVAHHNTRERTVLQAWQQPQTGRFNFG